MELAAILTFATDTTFHVIVESLRGSAAKLKYEPRWPAAAAACFLVAGADFSAMGKSAWTLNGKPLTLPSPARNPVSMKEAQNAFFDRQTFRGDRRDLAHARVRRRLGLMIRGQKSLLSRQGIWDLRAAERIESPFGVTRYRPYRCTLTILFDLIRISAAPCARRCE